ncbi:MULTISPECIES: hypothetical protein [unclassified Alteromonas]|jgi:ArsR family metal-binding transcriptional regulator|uniref:hypothetical protein n=1 Tax=unclassified Alteromonas TaxID=2614992 RepID=UPI001FCB9D49|nr:MULTISPECIES: hypothetical protein [unclassified Alteromonas]|tara:strand:+ start:3317 stop:3670 length:354 start_codon:yes stop_codon:yes gene_type:complete
MPAVFNAKVNDAFNEWSKGYGKIQHTSSTMNIVEKYLSQHYHAACGEQSELLNAIELLKAADRICSASMWLVAHMTYAKRVSMAGNPLNIDDFKEKAQGHTGGGTEYDARLYRVSSG